ncbi:prominin-like protein isoform X2 [Leptidea sinapis]|uniref:prominin-like protein isoform X2 n=1 Tax=Leptidea sinapis TaxID=189913 RepID=UPI0021C41609|nr:prominin-like protein isoform X2 [Leptidea sinapis]
MWCAYLFIVSVGSVSGQLWLANITDNLRQGMSNLIETSAVNYSSPVLNATYTAKVEFDMRAMGHLYNSTGFIIDLIAKKDAYPEGMVKISDHHVEVAKLNENWKKLLSFYAGPVAVIVVIALLIVILPLTGLFWCCCQLCKSGRRRRPFDRKCDACLKGVLAILLIAVLTLFLLGVVCAFATESQIDSGFAGITPVAHTSIKDTKTFLDTVQAHFRHLLVNNYKELEEEMNEMLTSSGRTVLHQLDEFTSATSVQKLINMVQQLDRVPDDLRGVQVATLALRSDAEKLYSGLKKVKYLIIRTLNDCTEKQCIQLQEKNKLGELETKIHYNKIPDVSELLSNVTQLLQSDIKKDVSAGLEVFSGIKRTVEQHIPTVQDAINSTGAQLLRVAEQITEQTEKYSLELDKMKPSVDNVQTFYEKYGPYRRSVTLVACCLLVLIVVLMSWGIMCGVCGKRPDVYGSVDCCNKGAGASCLLCGTAVTLFSGGVIALMLLIYFVSGVTLQRFVCDPATEPRNNRLVGDFDEFVDLEYYLFKSRHVVNITVSGALIACNSNDTVYEVFQLQHLYDLEAIKRDIEKEIQRRIDELRTVYPPRGQPLRILTPAAKDKLDRLAQTGLSEFNFDRILDALETNLTSLPLQSLSEDLRSTSRALAGRRGFDSVARDLQKAADQIDELQLNVVAPLVDNTRKLNKTASELRDVLRFNQSSLKEAIQYRIRDATEVELFLNTQGPDLVQNFTREFAEVVRLRLQEYMTRLVYAARNDVGTCEPLSNAINATRDAFCRATLIPVNGYWISLTWCMFLFVPMLVLAQRLARLYRHPDPYPGPLVEAEYLYDAYVDRDNIPLANSYKAEKRAGRSRREGRERCEGRDVREAREARGREETGALALAPPADVHHARRYNDMAPKHWEEGLPRYHGPTEYERPPPYYYPGPNDGQ